MKLLFVVPEAGRKLMFHQRHTFFDLAVPMLAARVPNDMTVTAVDENVEAIDFDADVDVVMLAVAMSPRAKRAYQIAAEFRQRGKLVIMGGTHVYFFSEEAAAHADAIVIGEAEGLWDELIDDLRAGRLKRVYQTSVLANFDDAPFPRFDLLKLDRYLIAPVQTTRGCPYECKFCSMWKYQGHRKLRHKPIERVIDEIAYLKKRPFRPFDHLPISVEKLFFFIDLNFCIDAHYMKALLERVGALNIRYWAQTSFSAIAGKKSGMIKLLADSGCRMLSVGIESLEDQDLIAWNKNKQRTDHELGTVFEMLHDAGIDFHANLIFGADNQDRDYFGVVEDFINRHHILGLAPSILYPLPTTETFEEYKDAGRLYYHPKPEYMMQSSLLHVPARMSREDFAEEFERFLFRINDPAEVLKRYEYVVSKYSLQKGTRSGLLVRAFLLLWLLRACMKSGVDLKTMLHGGRVLLKANDIRPTFLFLAASMMGWYKDVFSKRAILLESDRDPVYGDAYYRLTGKQPPLAIPEADKVQISDVVSSSQIA